MSPLSSPLRVNILPREPKHHGIRRCQDVGACFSLPHFFLNGEIAGKRPRVPLLSRKAIIHVKTFQRCAPRTSRKTTSDSRFPSVLGSDLPSPDLHIHSFFPPLLLLQRLWPGFIFTARGKREISPKGRVFAGAWRVWGGRGEECFGRSVSRVFFSGGCFVMEDFMGIVKMRDDISKFLQCDY